MRAFLIREPGRHALADIPEPTMRADEVLVHVRAATICHSDLQILRGKRRHRITYPLVPGHEFCGTIQEVGSAVEGYARGDFVACEAMLWCGRCRACRSGETSLCENYREIGCTQQGAFAERVAMPARLLHRVENVSDPAVIAMAEPTANAVRAVRLACISAGDCVAIIGPGPLGLLALQVARTLHPDPLIVIGTREERLAAARAMGATHVVNGGLQDAAAAVRDITDGRGARKIIQCAPTAAAFTLALQIAGFDATVVVEAVADEDAPWNVTLNRFVIQSLAIIGVAGYSSGDFHRAVGLLARGIVDARPLVTHRYPLRQIEEAFGVVEQRKDGAIKVCITFDPPA
jgi:threonine dehydrogenase-like Zn-dependent dehydrogenase